LTLRCFTVGEHNKKTLADKAFPGKGNPVDDELARLRKENAQLKEERDFLKLAANYFAKQ
jgi:transposase-like protein